MIHADKGQAKKVIAEILRQAGGELGKTKLYKAFWLAHLFYCKSTRGYLTDWPIVRLPKGPGINNGDRLLAEMEQAGTVRVEHVPKGPFTEICCKLIAASPDDLPEAAIAAIASAINELKDHTADSISALSHEQSRSWATTPNGHELDIYSDLIPDDVYAERQRELQSLKKAYESLFPE